MYGYGRVSETFFVVADLPLEAHNLAKGKQPLQYSISGSFSIN